MATAVVAKTTNSTTTYEPIKVGSYVEITFTKVVTSSVTTIYGKITRNNVESGSIAYDSRSDYLNTSLKPYSGFQASEISTIYTNIPTYISDIKG